jgi:hypothetical protein
MRLQGSRFLDLQEFSNVHFTSLFSEAFQLEWLRLPGTVHSYIPSANVCWIADGQIMSVTQERWRESRWAISLNRKSDVDASKDDLSISVGSIRHSVGFAWHIGGGQTLACQ